MIMLHTGCFFQMVAIASLLVIAGGLRQKKSIIPKPRMKCGNSHCMYIFRTQKSGL